MKEKLTDLLKVKTIVTILITIVFVVLALTGKITPDQVMMIVTTVIAFYFGTQTEKRSEKSDPEEKAEAIMHEKVPPDDQEEETDNEVPSGSESEED